MPDRIKIKEIVSIFSTHHERGKISTIKNRFAYGLSFATNGKIVYHKDQATITEDSEHVVLLPMGESYWLQCTEKGDFPLINFTAVEPLTKDILAFSLSRHAVLTDKFHSLREAFFAYGNTARAMSLFYDLLDTLAHENGKAEPNAVKLATEYILAHFADETLSAERIAAAAGVSDAYLRRLFRTSYGMPPKAYLQDVRIRRAKELLSLNFLSVGEIASACGYASIYHFCRAFKTQCGQTPKEYSRTYPGTL